MYKINYQVISEHKVVFHRGGVFFIKSFMPYGNTIQGNNFIRISNGVFHIIHTDKERVWKIFQRSNSDRNATEPPAGYAVSIYSRKKN